MEENEINFKKIQRIAMKVVEQFTRKHFTVLECLTALKVIEQSLLKSIKKDGEENGNKTETIQD